MLRMSSNQMTLPQHQHVTLISVLLSFLSMSTLSVRKNWAIWQSLRDFWRYFSLACTQLDSLAYKPLI